MKGTLDGRINGYTPNRLNSGNLPEKVGALRRFVGYALPIFQKYDVLGRAEALMSDSDVKEAGVSLDEVCGYLDEGSRNYKWLVRFARVADTADKVTSTIGTVLESAGIGAGVIPGLAANVGEEAVEMVFKAPFYINLALKKNERQRIKGLLLREAATFGVPVLGDAYDILRNLYTGTADEMIRDYAKSKIGSREAAKTELQVGA